MWQYTVNSSSRYFAPISTLCVCVCVWGSMIHNIYLCQQREVTCTTHKGRALWLFQFECDRDCTMGSSTSYVHGDRWVLTAGMRRTQQKSHDKCEKCVHDNGLGVHLVFWLDHITCVCVCVCMCSVWVYALPIAFRYFYRCLISKWRFFICYKSKRCTLKDVEYVEKITHTPNTYRP